MGIDDPVVAFIPVKDKDLCEECERLHLMSDRICPRVWFYSEIQGGYFHRGDDTPSWNLLHPHCRCTPSTVLPGFGFDGNGRVMWIKQGFLELDFQRSVDYVLGVDARKKFEK